MNHDLLKISLNHSEGGREGGRAQTHQNIRRQLCTYPVTTISIYAAFQSTPCVLPSLPPSLPPLPPYSPKHPQVIMHATSDDHLLLCGIPKHIMRPSLLQLLQTIRVRVPSPPPPPPTPPPPPPPPPPSSFHHNPSSLPPSPRLPPPLQQRLPRPPRHRPLILIITLFIPPHKMTRHLPPGHQFVPKPPPILPPTPRMPPHLHQNIHRRNMPEMQIRTQKTLMSLPRFFPLLLIPLQTIT